MKSKKLIIIGDSAFAEIAHEYFEYDSIYNVVAFSVERDFLKKDNLNFLPVLPFEDIEKLYDPEEYEVFVAVTYTKLNRVRTRLINEAKSKGYRLASYISSQSFVWRNVKLGEHCFIFENNTIQPYVSIESNVIIWSGNHIGHHSLIKKNCFISSHVVISGFCEIGNNCFIGVNSTLANNVTIGNDNWIGPNVTIMKNTEVDEIYKSDHHVPSKIKASRFFKISE